MSKYLLLSSPYNKISCKYALLIKEYMNYAGEMDCINNSTNVLSIGVTAIHRVFEYVLLKEKSLENAFYLSKKAYCYYLEYIQQMYKLNLLKDLICKDAVLLVYNKTIFVSSETNNVVNMLEMSETSIHMNVEELQEIMCKLLCTTTTLMNWENKKFTCQDRIEIVDQYLERFYKQNEKKPKLLDYTYKSMCLISQKNDMNIVSYKEMLNEILLKLEKKKMNFDENLLKAETLLNKYYVDEENLTEKLTIRELVDWMYAMP